MTWDDFWWLRLINLSICFISVVLLGLYLWQRRMQTPRRYRRIGWSMWTVLVMISYASGRAVSLGAPVAEHTALAVLSSSTFLFAMIWHPEGDDRLPPNDGSVTERALKALRYYRYRFQRGTRHG